MNLDKNNSEDLAFALAAVSCQALTIDEFKEWVCFVIGNEEDYPAFFIDLLNVEYMVDIFKVIDFSPSLDARESIEKSLYGIAYRRFDKLFDAAVDRETAQKLLEMNEGVEQRYMKMFPFLK